MPGRPEDVFPWLVQLGKGGAGWYLTRRLDRLLPRSRRAIRHIDPRWQSLSVGDVVPDYGGRNESFTVASIDPPRSIVYESRRRDTHISWAITLTAVGGGASTRVQLRLRAGPVKHRRVWGSAGELLDMLTVAGMAAGVRERLAETAPIPDDT